MDIVTSAIVEFEMSFSKALKNGEIDKREFQVLQELHLKLINELFNVERKMEVEMKPQLQNNLLDEINEIRKP